MEDKFLDVIKKEQNVSYTENNAEAYATTYSDILNAFAVIGANYYLDEKYIKTTFAKACDENIELAVRYLFYLRDIRGGQGMRKAFRICALYLAENYPEYILNNINNIPFFGRWDDLIYIWDKTTNVNIQSACLHLIRETLLDDFIAANINKEVSLLGKWMPSANTSSNETRALANRMIKALGASPKTYRQVLSRLRKAINIVENNLCRKTYDKIDYSEVPSKASNIYSDAFYRHDKDRYEQYLTDVAIGKAKINSGALFPFDIVKSIYGKYNNPIKDKVADLQWKALPNYFEERNETGICVVDTSGSMQGDPILVALSLGLYCADKCKGPYKNHFITFSAFPELQEIRGTDLSTKLDSMERAGWGMNTNLEKVFMLILDIAIKNHLKQDEIPNKLYIISDMQFDQSASDPNCKFMDSIKKLYKEANYEMPSIVYWNVGSYTTGIFHQTINNTDFCMISGYSPSLFKSVIDGTEYKEVKDENGNIEVKQKIDPIKIMLTAIMDERYDRVWVG